MDHRRIKLFTNIGILFFLFQSCGIQSTNSRVVLNNIDNFSGRTSLQPEDTISTFDKLNDKAEVLFKYLPVPIYSRSTEAGNIFGFAKFNLFRLSKKDSISSPSIVSGIATISTKNRVNISLGGELLFKENEYIFNSYLNYIKTPAYMAGIGNYPRAENLELVTTNRFKLIGSLKKRIVKDLYAGIQFDIANYFKVETDSNSYLVQNNVLGLEGGYSNGLGLVLFLDKRDNRYNPSRGSYGLATIMTYQKFIGSDYKYVKFQLDLRKYFNPWYNHVFAIQGTTFLSGKGAPFYELSLMGGDSRMRGYYLGRYRDHVLIDGQMEYRMHVWNRFGIVVFCGAGRVANSYQKMSIDGINPNYGFGFRTKVDSKNNTNLRIDFGFGHKGINGVYINFSEAF